MNLLVYLHAYLFLVQLPVFAKNGEANEEQAQKSGSGHGGRSVRKTDAHPGICKLARKRI